jgi:hypothetical protein
VKGWAGAWLQININAYNFYGHTRKMLVRLPCSNAYWEVYNLRQNTGISSFSKT